MNIIKFIPKEKVAELGFALVKKARKNLRLTMIMSDELSTTASAYLKLLKRKIDQEIDIKRVGFGTKTEYLKAYKQLGIVGKNFVFKHNPDMKQAQRLLISDEKEMLFAVYLNKTERLVFYTRSKPIINGFINYFNEIFNRSEFINYNLVQ